jgi:hypothetical protein
MPTRAVVISFSVIACTFGVLSLYGPEDQRSGYYAINVVLAITSAILASIDLRKRGYGWGWAMLAAYVLPLVGTILYIVFSSQRGYARDLAHPSGNN